MKSGVVMTPIPGVDFMETFMAKTDGISVSAPKKSNQVKSAPRNVCGWGFSVSKFSLEAYSKATHNHLLSGF